MRSTRPTEKDPSVRSHCPSLQICTFLHFLGRSQCDLPRKCKSSHRCRNSEASIAPPPQPPQKGMMSALSESSALCTLEDSPGADITPFWNAVVYALAPPPRTADIILPLTMRFLLFCALQGNQVVLRRHAAYAILGFCPSAPQRHVPLRCDAMRCDAQCEAGDQLGELLRLSGLQESRGSLVVPLCSVSCGLGRRHWRRAYVTAGFIKASPWIHHEVCARFREICHAMKPPVSLGEVRRLIRTFMVDISP